MGIPTKEEVLERERLAESNLKRCSVKSGCGEIKSVEDFGLNRSTWDKKLSICKMCNRNKAKKHYKDNGDARKAYARQYRIENLEARREYGRTYNRKYYQANIEERLEYSRKYHERRRQADPLFARLDYGKSRAKKAGADWENISSANLLPYWEQEGIDAEVCYFCKQTIDEDDLEIDHGQPIGRGGSHTLDNLFPTHRRCNLEKSDMNVEEYFEYLMQVV